LWPATTGESYMTVITETSTGVQRPYSFHLVAKPASDDVQTGDVTLNLIFKGGVAPGVTAATTDDPSPAVRPRLARYRRDPNALEDAAMRLRTDSFNPADDQCHYVAHGVRPNAITPLCPLSNGVWTLFRFPGLSKKPSIYIVGSDGAERLARQHESGDFVVVEEIAQHFRLRLSPDVLDILNTGYNPAGNPSGSGTIAPSVQRQILQARTP
jgi:type IV secretion system protein VirB9